MEDKRKYLRLDKDVIIDFKLVNSLDKYQMGISENISQDGVKVETVNDGKPFTKGQFVEMALKGAGPGQGIKVLGQIIWVSRMRPSWKAMRYHPLYFFPFYQCCDYLNNLFYILISLSVRNLTICISLTYIYP